MSYSYLLQKENTIEGIALSIICIGLAMFMAAWLVFRLPNQGIWVFAPIWKASDYLKPTGVKLWVAGVIIGMIGVLLYWVPFLWLVSYFGSSRDLRRNYVEASNLRLR